MVTCSFVTTAGSSAVRSAEATDSVSDRQRNSTSRHFQNVRQRQTISSYERTIYTGPEGNHHNSSGLDLNLFARCKIKTDTLIQSPMPYDFGPYLHGTHKAHMAILPHKPSGLFCPTCRPT